VRRENGAVDRPCRGHTRGPPVAVG